MRYSNKSLIELKIGLITFLELVASEWHYAQSIEMYGRKKKKIITSGVFYSSFREKNVESDKNLTGIGDLTLTEGKQVSLNDTEFDYESLGKTANDQIYQVSNRYDFSSLRELDSIGHNELKPFQNQQWTYSVLKHLKLEDTETVWYSEINTQFSDDSSSLFDFSFIEKTPSDIDQPGTHHMQHQQAQQPMIVLPNCWRGVHFDKWHSFH